MHKNVRKFTLKNVLWDFSQSQNLLGVNLHILFCKLDSFTALALRQSNGVA